MHGSSDASWEGQASDAAIAALRWVTSAGIAVDGGMAWREYTAPGTPICDDLYAGTAGVLAALAEARLSGITDFDDYARAAVRRLRSVASASAGSSATATDPAQAASVPNTGLYTGLSGMAAALHMWALVSGDPDARDGASAVVTAISGIAASTRPVSEWRDIIEGEAGVLLVLAELGDAGDKRVASDIADQLVSQARWIDGLPDWYPRADHPVFLPNFSHGLAGIGYALAAASTALGRPDLLEVALLAGQRLVGLGSRPDGAIAVPHSIPLADPDVPVCFGWCHGPAGTLRLFQLLDQQQPGRAWAGYAEACRRAIRSSGLPARLYPGFWDNLGQCCGTAGVGEMALDRYQETGDADWLGWAVTLAQDVLNRRIADESGVRWSHTEHRLDPPDLEPDAGWMQGAAGIASWLLRLARVGEEGVGATKLWWPDHPVSA
ncbi:MAG TPA: lanthionine synthetase LanC family protein [Streptosporangiaceae bacterium]|nr:lanthionine synthetase LanC family protein [Streptosporangiaceae bacterium]